MSSEPEELFEDAPSPEGWSEEDAELDRLYREALSVVDSIEQDMQLPWNGATTAEAKPHENDADHDAASARSQASSHRDSADETDEAHTLPIEAAFTNATGRITPRQVLEAALFVGGKPLSTRSLVHLLRDEFTTEYVDDALQALGMQYAEEGRPYDVRLVEGGWQLALRSEFEKVRHRVFGLGPK